MTQEDKRLKIAEACGWTNIMEQDYNHGYSGDDVRQYWMGTPPDDLLMEIPDYFNCLNACHQMEAIMDIDEGGDYAERLGMKDPIYGHHAVMAPASERAEAGNKKP